MDFLDLVPVEDWHAQAQCRGTSTRAFFPNSSKGVPAALALCNGCPVQVECLEYALYNNVRYGVFGGESERSRRRMRRDLGLVGEEALAQR